MIAVIFEAVPAGEAQMQEYLSIAANLKPVLEGADGFISIERFQSLANPEKVLSLSFWKDEQSVEKWRNMELHRFAQAQGRDRVFKDYRLRIAGVIRNYGMYDRSEAPADSKQYHTEPPK